MTLQRLDDFNLELCDAIAQRISQSPQRRITFSEYMDLVLYHPSHGYYATNQVNIGALGDFFTSPHLSADFGEMLAEQFFQMWEVLGRPAPFTLLEMGAGQGILAGDILRYLHKHYFEFFDSLEYIIVEKSTALRKEQQQRLQNLPLRWCQLEEIETNSITGCCFSNELVDAFPVHQFVIEKGQLREVYVRQARRLSHGQARRLSHGQARRLSHETGKSQESNQESSQFLIPNPLPEFVEVTDEPSCDRLIKYFDLLGIDLTSGAYPDGYRSEINLVALDWLSTVADQIKRGYLLTIDYGYPANRYYSPGRSQGTLQCYYHHSHHNNPYINIGRQDITAHVNFTALEKWGELCGLVNVGFTQQGLFLMALGLGDRIAALSNSDASDYKEIQKVLQRRDALHQLINPMGLGNFGVLVQSKGLTEEEKLHTLKGLSIPNY